MGRDVKKGGDEDCLKRKIIVIKILNLKKINT